MARARHRWKKPIKLEECVRKLILSVACLFALNQGAIAKDEAPKPLKTLSFLISRIDNSDPFYKDLFGGLSQLKIRNFVSDIKIVNYNGSKETLAADFDKALQYSSAIVMDYVPQSNLDYFANRSKDKNVPLVFLFTPPTPQILSKYPNVFFITQDDIQSGITQGLMVSKYFEQHPEADKNHDGIINILDVSGAGYKVPDEKERFSWLFNTINSYPGNKFKAHEVANMPAYYNSKKAYNIVDNAIKSGQIQQVEAIISQGDNMTRAAADALADAKIHLPVFGRGMSPQTRQYIAQGKIVGTVLSSPKLASYYAGLLAYDYQNRINPSNNIPYAVYHHSIVLPYKIITKANLHDSDAADN